MYKLNHMIIHSESYTGKVIDRSNNKKTWIKACSNLPSKEKITKMKSYKPRNACNSIFSNRGMLFKLIQLKEYTLQIYIILYNTHIY